MRDLPVSSAAVVWTATGPKIVRTDDCGDVIDARVFTRARAKALPESLARLFAPGQAPGQAKGQA